MTNTIKSYDLSLEVIAAWRYDFNYKFKIKLDLLKKNGNEERCQLIECYMQENRQEVWISIIETDNDRNL